MKFGIHVGEIHLEGTVSQTRFPPTLFTGLQGYKYGGLTVDDIF